jgi:type II secretory pathway pseudopilin PulG
MVVLVVIGIMAAAIIPEMRGSYEDAILRSTARELVSVFDVASSRAVSMNQTLRFQIDARTSRYFVGRKVSNGDGPEAYSPLRDVLGAEGRFDSRVKVEIHTPDEAGAESPEDESPAGEPEGRAAGSLRGIKFQPDGTCDAAEIEIKDRNGFRLGLNLNPITARPRLTQLERK